LHLDFSEKNHRP